MGKRERRRRREASALVTTLSGAPPPTRGALPSVDVLRGLVARREQLERAIGWEADQLAQSGVGWPAIADALGVSRQATRQAAIRRRERG